MSRGSCWRSGTAEADGDEVEAGDAVEVADAGGADAPSGGHGGGGDDPVVGADIDACGGELGRDAAWARAVSRSKAMGEKAVRTARRTPRGGCSVQGWRGARRAETRRRWSEGAGCGLGSCWMRAVGDEAQPSGVDGQAAAAAAAS